MSEKQEDVASLKRELISTQEHNQRLKDALREAKGQLEIMRTELQEISEPPLSFAIFEGYCNKGAKVAHGGTHRMVALSRGKNLTDLQPGDGLWLDTNLVVIDRAPTPEIGTTASVVETSEKRAVVKLAGGNERVVSLAHSLPEEVKAGDTLLVDSKNLWAFQMISRAEVEQNLAPKPPGITYGDIGGLDNEISRLRQAVELPYRHPELFSKYNLRTPRGVLLYGPPGCGKTMLAKAVASALSLDGDSPSVFLSVKGPELLSKFVGETERQIRAIFDRARKLSSESHPVVVFFDEMESLFRTRGSGISTDIENLLVPQLLTEMDGLEELKNVVVIGASNREDLIDPALLRPGRFDLKIRVGRPGPSAARQILAHLLSPATPFDTSEVASAGSPTIFAVNLTEVAVNHLFARNPATYLCTVNIMDASGSSQAREVYFSDFISGAGLVGIAQEAKHLAIERELDGKGAGLRLQDLEAALGAVVEQTAALTTLLPPEVLARELGVNGSIVSVYRDTSINPGPNASGNHRGQDRASKKGAVS